jgi:putative Mg2+ transporter-C (MgtC) family protein
VSEVETIDHGDDLADVVATLVSTSVVAEELDAVVARLEKQPGVDHVTWESNTKS